jgi:predicted nucleic acid-binding protein
MALTHLVDTSVLTRLANPAVRGVVQPLADAARLARTPVSDLEIGFSARSAEEWDTLSGALEVLPLVEVHPEHFVRAKQVQRLLASRGHRGRKVPDLLIAAVAELRRLTVLHYDRDFDLIADATGQPVRWVAEPGSID